MNDSKPPDFAVICIHEQLKRQCELCAKDAEIEMLTQRLTDAMAALAGVGGIERGAYLRGLEAMQAKCASICETGALLYESKAIREIPLTLDGVYFILALGTALEPKAPGR